MSRLQRQAEAARLDQTLIFAWQNREREILLARALCEAVAAAVCFRQPLSRSARQSDLQRLARAP